MAHLERHQWGYGLVPERRKGNMPGAPKADIDPGLWDFIKSEWLTQSKPAIRHIYRRAVELANARDLDLPSEKTIARRLAALPLPLATLMREGEKALDDMYPPMRRDYSTLAVHEIWNADGHMFDAHVRWADGSVSRPIVLAWQDVRTRMIVGCAIGKSESAQAHIAGVHCHHAQTMPQWLLKMCLHRRHQGRVQGLEHLAPQPLSGFEQCLRRDLLQQGAAVTQNGKEDVKLGLNGGTNAA